LEDTVALFAGFHPERALVTAPTEATFGMATIGGLRPERFARAATLRLVRPGFLPFDQNLSEIRPGYALALGEIEFTPVPTLRVRVVDDRTREPIRGARVVALENPSGLEPGPAALGAPTDGDGEVRIASFGGAASSLGVRAAGYAPARRFGPFGGGYSQASLEIGLVRGATATVRVVDAAGDAIPAARVELVVGGWSPNEAFGEPAALGILERPDARVSRIADEGGKVVFRNLAPGRNAFRVQQGRGYLDGEWSLRELSNGEVTDVVLVSTASATLELRVTLDRLPLPGAAVVFLRRQDVPDPIALLDARVPLPPGVDVHLDARGAARIQNLPAGSFLLAVDVPGQALRAILDGSLPEGVTHRTYELGDRSIFGRVVFEGSGPIAGASIHLVVWERRSSRVSWSQARELGALEEGEHLAHGLDTFATISDERGTFRVLGLPPDARYVVQARSGTTWSATSRPTRVETAAGGAVPDLALEAFGAIEVRVETTPGPVSCLLAATARSSRALPRVRRTVSGRSEVLAGLEPGNWDLVIDAGSLGFRRDRIEVVAGETAVIEFALP
jgi:hypothetical protein